ncbi:MAG TPA: hypothetical protein VM076_07030 [Gemmatimonadaceae bacterium]|nr:hypothetical protein [Gemmatimonadaceae bacterium]
MFNTRSALFAAIASSCLPPLAAGCGAVVERPGFEAEVRGAVEATMRGTTAFTPTTLTLSAGDGSRNGGTLVFAASDGAGLTTGSYDVSPRARSASVNALYIAGTPSRPLGVFRGRTGALTVTAATEERIAGRFELEAVGVIAGGGATRTDSAAVRVSGSFLVLDPCAAAISQAAAPCARHSSRAKELRLRTSPSESTTRSTTIRSRK